MQPPEGFSVQRAPLAIGFAPAFAAPTLDAPSTEVAVLAAVGIAALIAVVCVVMITRRRGTGRPSNFDDVHGYALGGATPQPLRPMMTAPSPVVASPPTAHPAPPEPSAGASSGLPPVAQPAPAPTAPAPAAAVRNRPAAHVAPAAGPHPSGLGAVELAALVEAGLGDLEVEIASVELILAEVDRLSALPDDLPDRPAAEQMRLAAELAATVDAPLARSVQLLEGSVLDLARADRALCEVRAELVRIGLRSDFFSRMETGALELAHTIEGLEAPASRLLRRFVALSTLFSTLVPVTAQLETVALAVRRASRTTAPWRGGEVEIDLREPVVAPGYQQQR